MFKRKSRHDAFIESLNTYMKKNGSDPKTINYRSRLLLCSRTSRWRRGDTGLKLCPRGVKSDKREISTTPSPDTITEPIDVDKSSNSDKDDLDGDDTKSESDKSNAEQSEVDSKTESEESDDTSSTSSKDSKHIHPCRCDLTEQQLKKIQEYEESRRISREIFNERLLSVKQYLRDTRGDARSVTSTKSTSRSRRGSKVKSDDDDDDDDYDRKSLRKYAERTTTIKKKGKRRPKGVELRRPKTKVHIKKQYGPTRQTKIGITLKLNWRKPPLIPVKQTKTSVLRESERAYCGVRNCKMKPIPVCQGDGVVFKVPVDKGTIRDNRTSSLRMQFAKDKKFRTPETFKYDRAPFETDPKIYHYLKPAMTELKINR